MAAITAPGLTVAQLDTMARSYEQAAECGVEKVAAATAGTDIKIILIGDSGDSAVSFRQLMTDEGDLVSG